MVNADEMKAWSNKYTAEQFQQLFMSTMVDAMGRRIGALPGQHLTQRLSADLYTRWT
jgi:hypothetical protein